METRDEKVKRLKDMHQEISKKIDEEGSIEEIEELSQQMTTLVNELEAIDRQGDASC